MKRSFVGLLSLLVGFAAWGAAELPGIFSDHAVLAKRNGVPIFGKADPGEEILVEFGPQKAAAKAGSDGRWQVKLDLADYPAGPFELKVNQLTVKDVLVGEVFLASGQSNMAFRLERADGFAAEKARPADRELRFFTIPTTPQAQPAEEVRGRWVIAAPETVGSFSAVAYFFAREIREQRAVPVGIVNASVGGTEIECWMRKEALAEFPNTVRAGKEREELFRNYQPRYAEFLQANRAWEAKYGRSYTAPALPGPEAKWEKASSPLTFGNGIFYTRIRIKVTPAMAKSGFRINLQRMYTPMTMFVDGRKFCEHKDDRAYQYPYFSYNVHPKKLTAGTHEVIIRYFVTRDRVRVTPQAHFGPIVVMEREWEVFRAKEFGKPEGEAAASRPPLPGLMPSRNRLWSRLYNGMIHPLQPWKFCGVLWYQGESNERNPGEYRRLFPALIRDWRSGFDDPRLPFFFCQLPAYRQKSADPEPCGRWAALRSAQAVAWRLPDTYMAVLIDTGEAGDVHPRDKRTPGHRLALAALKYLYGADVIASGPRAVRAVRRNDRAVVRFSGTSGGLCAQKLPAVYLVKADRTAPLVRNSPQAQVEGFALAGPDGRWFWADRAEISGAEVVVRSEHVPNPVKVRYGWMDHPTCNLYNGAGLPAAPFEMSVN